MRPGIALFLVVWLSVSCGGNGPTATTSTTSRVTTTTTTSPPTTKTPTSTTTSGVTTTTTTTPEIDVEFREGEVIGPGNVGVGLGETVDVWILSDVDDEVHVHGYDLFFDLDAGVPSQLTFTADVPGIFEVEVHTGHTRLFELEVSG